MDNPYFLRKAKAGEQIDPHYGQWPTFLELILLLIYHIDCDTFIPIVDDKSWHFSAN